MPVLLTQSCSVFSKALEEMCPLVRAAEHLKNVFSVALSLQMDTTLQSA